MRKVAFLAMLSSVLFTLYACSSASPKIETVYVKVPVPVPCIKKERVPNKPLFAVDQVRGDESLEEITDAYMVDRHQRRIYERQLEALLAGCITNED
jgi:hypothetical protein